ncbi:MAG: hypothetical protein LBB84_06755 [Tannerellaceae bacterium]|jgi:hypothetical protein|nr:hypothetical protein [Tannerellaceae bacterium]
MRIKKDNPQNDICINYVISTFPVLFVLCLAISSFSGLHAQMTIGLGTPPAKAALLQLKDKEPSPGTKDATATGGLLLPRVELASRDALPLLINPTSADKKDHTGLLVYNLTENAALQLEKGIYQWDGDKWKKLDNSVVTNTAGSTVKKEAYRGTVPNENHVLSLGIYEFRMVNKTNATYPQFRLAPDSRSQADTTLLWQVSKYWDNNQEAEKGNGYSFWVKKKTKSELPKDGWVDCRDSMRISERNEVWIADLKNENMYRVQFLIFGSSTPANQNKTYAIIARKY